MQRLEHEQIPFGNIPGLPGWFLLQMANLSPERCEMVLAALPELSYDLERLRQSLVRLFNDVRRSEGGRPMGPQGPGGKGP